MNICENSYNQVIEWFESDFLIRKLTNKDVNLILHKNWSVHERRGKIHYGNLDVEFLKDFFKLEISSFRPLTYSTIHDIFERLNIKCVIRHQVIVDIVAAKNISYDSLDIIIKFLEFV